MFALALAFGARNAVADTGDSGGPFAWSKPMSAPSGWHRLVVAGGEASLSYPPGFTPATSDSGAASAALGPAPAYRAYLNVTPRQGDERTQDFAAFRTAHLRDEGDRLVRDDGGASGLHFFGGTGSGVADDYVTRAGSHHYDEFAVLVRGRRDSWVVVGSVLAPDVAKLRPLVERAIDSFRTN